jgi:hypothetical protein
VGNPASVKRKKTEKRRKKYEERLGPGAYLPKAEREKVNASVAKLLADKKVASEAAKKARAEKKATPAATA